MKTHILVTAAAAAGACALLAGACGGSVTTTGDTRAEPGDPATDRDGVLPDATDPAAEADGDAVAPRPPGPVDILVVVDNSGSMAEEQEGLAAAFPLLLGDLLDPPVDQSTGRRVHEPVRDVHVGVVSTDLGVGGYTGVSSCERNPVVGDDGMLRNTSRAAGCATTYPRWLSYAVPAGAEPDRAAVGTLAGDFGCVAILGTDGCGFEQQLEAGLRALTGQAGPGKPNEGFLRPDATLAVIFLTDENDCSAADPALFDVAGLPYSINLQCWHERARLFDPSRYVQGLRSLKADPAGVVVGMLVGVPPGAGCEGRGDRIGGCLELEAMKEEVAPNGDRLEFACLHPPGCTPPGMGVPPDCRTVAFPATRFVQAAQGLGAGAVVRSICAGDFGPPLAAITSAIVEAATR